MPRETGQQDLFKKQPVWWEGLTGRRRLFVEYFCTDRTCFCNAGRAYVKAYGSDNESSIKSNSSRLMRDPAIKNAVSRLLRSRQNEEDEITEYQILDLLKKLSFYNPGDILNGDGTLKGSLDELGDMSLCVAGVRRNRHGKEIKLFDRTKALAMLCDYLNITRPEERATIINPVVYLNDKDVEALRGDETPAPAPAQDAEYEVVEA